MESGSQGGVKTVEVVLVDDAEDVRAVVGRQLRLSGRFVVVGEGGTGVEAITLAERHPQRELEIAVREGRYEEEGWRPTSA